MTELDKNTISPNCVFGFSVYGLLGKSNSTPSVAKFTTKSTIFSERACLSLSAITINGILFENFATIQRSRYLSFNDEDLNNNIEKYVSIPSQDSSHPSPHLTGGAIDLTIIDNNKLELEMGTAFDSFEDKSKTTFFEQLTKPSFQELIYLKNRRILFNLLSFVGFTNYPYEWWHYDYGNQYWAIQRNKQTAFYNKIIIE